MPEWQNLIQTGLENHPLLDHWLPESVGVDIEYVESPALLAFLLHECQSLIAIGQELDQELAISWIKNQVTILEKGLSEFWSQKDSLYLYRDYQNHTNCKGETLLEFSGPGSYSIKNKKNIPERLQLVITNLNESTRTIVASIFGEGVNGKEITEKFTTRDVVWILGKATYTSRNLFSKIIKFDINGLQQDDLGQLSTIDYTMEDISLFLPLWAHAVPDKISREKMVEKLKKSYLFDQGLSNYPNSTHINSQKSLEMSPVWNFLVLEGLLEYGYRELVAEILIKYLNSGADANNRSQPYSLGFKHSKFSTGRFFLKTYWY